MSGFFPDWPFYEKSFYQKLQNMPQTSSGFDAE
jgi:hypothetical protein